jgi:hypothetical protein
MDKCVPPNSGIWPGHEIPVYLFLGGIFNCSGIVGERFSQRDLND